MLVASPASRNLAALKIALNRATEDKRSDGQYLLPENPLARRKQAGQGAVTFELAHSQGS